MGKLCLAIKVSSIIHAMLGKKTIRIQKLKVLVPEYLTIGLIKAYNLIEVICHKMTAFKNAEMIRIVPHLTTEIVVLTISAEHTEDLSQGNHFMDTFSFNAM